MIILITGVPGSFKTLFAMDLLTKPDFKERTVYSNIAGSDHLPIPNDDWRDTPEGSLVIYDESQGFFPSTGKSGSSSDPRVVALDQHRHTGHDIIFITQRYTLIHHHIRGFVGRHYHLIRKSKSVATLYTNGEVFNTDDKKLIKTVTSSIFVAPSALFNSYQSSSIHTKVQTGIRLPIWIWFAIFLFFIGLYFVYHSGASFFSHSSATATSSVHTLVAPPLNVPSNNLSTPLLPSSTNSSTSLLTPSQDAPKFVKSGYLPLKGCIASATSCQCFDSSGNPVLLTPDLCASAVSSHGYITLAVSDDTHRDSHIIQSPKTLNSPPFPSTPSLTLPLPIPTPITPIPPNPPIALSR